MVGFALRAIVACQRTHFIRFKMSEVAGVSYQDTPDLTQDLTQISPRLFFHNVILKVRLSDLPRYHRYSIEGKWGAALFGLFIKKVRHW